ncbi:MAG: flagellar biosynthesis regulator FlaF [Sulfitobacter sp.]
MNASLKAQQAYAPSSSAIKSARSIEYDVIARITYRMKSAVETGDFKALNAAIYENRKLWRVLAIDVVDPGNQLPQELRARILYLAQFTDQHSSKVIRREENAIPLLEINTAILRGLKQEGASQ